MIEDATDIIRPIKMTKETFEKLIIKAIEKDSFPQLGIQWIHEAELLPGILDWPENLKKPERFIGDHAVQITGVILAKNGSITHFKIKNSWGPHAGLNGNYLLTARYFYNFADSVHILERRP